MRLKPANSAFLLAMSWTLLGSFSSTAQEERSHTDVEVIAKETQKETQRTDPDPVLNSESPESRTKPVTPVSSTKEIHRDTIQSRTVKPVKPVEKTQKEEDPLSFNFLYYIIEKFKLSDIIE